MFNYSKLDTPEALRHIFHPHPSHKTLPVNGSIDVEFKMDLDVIISCRFHLIDKQAPVILYFHGNAEEVSDYDPIGPMYTAAGMNFIVTEYRGYGWSSGSPTVTSMFSDSRHLLDDIAKWLAANQYTGALFTMGRSLGSACAIDICCYRGEMIKGLIIESGFCDTLPLIKSLGLDPSVLDIKESDCFNNREKISKVKHPTLILHGSNDSLIPLNEAEKLQSYSGARSKEFQVIPGANHSTTISTGGDYYFLAIKQFIDKVTGTSSWRNRRKKQKRND